jgi:uncharacterized protein
MKFNFILFFSIVLLVHGSVNYYIFIRGYQALEFYPNLRPYYIPMMLFLSLSYIVGRIFENFYLSSFSEVLVWVGSFWMAAMLYFFLLIVFIDIIRLLDHWFLFIPDWIRNDYSKIKFIIWITGLTIVMMVLMLGFFNALHPRIRNLDITIPKARGGAPLTIAAATDLHLGTIIGKHRFGKIVQKINELKPDLIVLPGDIVDEDLAPVLRQDIGAMLLNLQSPFGVFAVTGNHEYIGGVDAACEYLEKHHIRVLRDTAVCIDQRLYLIGREDRSIRGFRGLQRKSLPEILNGIDKAYPLLLMDHQPIDLGDAVANGVDLQISGHTHDGQLWPLNYITDLIYEMSHGYIQKGATQIYVSCGTGTWGPPIRIGHRPEIVLLRIKFTEN